MFMSSKIRFKTLRIFFLAKSLRNLDFSNGHISKTKNGKNRKIDFSFASEHYTTFWVKKNRVFWVLQPLLFCMLLTRNNLQPEFSYGSQTKRKLLINLFLQLSYCNYRWACLLVMAKLQYRAMCINNISLVRRM